MTPAPPDLAIVRPVDLAMPFNRDAACVSVDVDAVVETLPVDIIWIVDNSASMEPAIKAVTAGLNQFAQVIGASKLDYRIVMLSLQSKTNPVMVGGSNRYGVCIPPPLSGDANCGDGPRFFQSSTDIKSTQPLEQFLGTLGQTTGYTPGTSRGGPPWRMALRDAATKTIVIVTDDNSRLSANDFLHFQGGTNPANQNLKLPPGILDPSWKGLFANYTFNGIYGWGDPNDPGAKCMYMNGASPPSPGAVYTTLVTGSNGVRAKICDGANAWAPFFMSVAQAVTKTSRIACDVVIPKPQNGNLDPSQVNVTIAGGMGETTLRKVADAAACGNFRGWYYDDDMNPTRVILCPAACTFAQSEVQGGGGVRIAFGCDTLIQ